MLSHEVEQKIRRYIYLRRLPPTDAINDELVELWDEEIDALDIESILLAEIDRLRNDYRNSLRDTAEVLKERDQLLDSLEKIKKVTGHSTLQWKIAENAISKIRDENA